MRPWAGMVCSSLIALHHPSGALTFHPTFTDVAIEIAREIEDHDAALDEIGELVSVLISDMSVVTHVGAFDLTELSPFEQFDETSTIFSL